MEEKASYNDAWKSDLVASPEIWLDETLSEEGLAAKKRLLDTRWSDVYGRKHLTSDQIAAQPFVLKYLETRIEILISLEQFRSEGRKDGKRLSDIESDKKKVLKLVSTEYFTEFLNAFGITEDHPLSPAHLVSKKLARVGDNSPKTPSCVDLAALLPHYISPWKNAILLALLAKGLNADYQTIAHYITEHFPLAALPDYCAGHKNDSIDYLVACIRDKVGNLSPRYPEINTRFQKDRGRIKSQLESYLKKRDSLGSQTTDRVSN